MSNELGSPGSRIGRRELLAASAGALLASRLGEARAAAQATERPTEFQIACMTLPYRDFPLARALEGIRETGYRYVAWGTDHLEESGRRVPVMPVSATAADAKRLGDRCRDLGLEPVM